MGAIAELGRHTQDGVDTFGDFCRRGSLTRFSEVPVDGQLHLEIKSHDTSSS